jgi:DNA (cytosine-5)-methyltransferase 1
MSKLKVVELFAGVGGFRLGLEGWKGNSATSGYKKPSSAKFEVVWSNQWEPSTKAQHASDIYVNRWGAESHSNQNISKVDVNDIPNHDVLVGGFPCQDYSVARVLSHSKGLEGKKGVLWWDIQRILEEKGKNKPSYLILENVDRLISSPASQRGRDFAIMLSSLSDLGYAVEWRIINAADYGFPQKRRRVFIVGYKKSSAQYKEIKKDPLSWSLYDGTLARSFPVNDILDEQVLIKTIDGELDFISDNFNLEGKLSPFQNSGVFIDRQFYTYKAKPSYDGPRTLLGDVLVKPQDVDEAFRIPNNELDKWKYFKGAKNELRKRRDGNTFQYNEGAMHFPDKIDSPSRTIITSEGGKTASRTTHVIKDNKGFRRLTPLELERLNMFPENHTKEATNSKRAFFMGNALVVGVVEKIGLEL